MSITARIFDPLGLLAPVISKANVFIQRLWCLHIDQNDTLPEVQHRECHQLLIGLSSINKINIKKCILIKQTTTIEVHGFSDGSESCFGAVVYCKSNNSTGETVVRLITNKFRITPVKSLTIPRLELAAAVLLSKLVCKLLTATKLSVTQIYLWTDSMIVLSWIQKEPADLKKICPDQSRNNSRTFSS